MVLTFDEFLDTVAVYPHDRFRFIVRELEPEDFDDFCKWVRTVGSLTLAIDEIDLWTKPNYTPPELERLVRYGRHHAVDLLVVARRPVDVPRLVTSQADVLFTYRQTEPADLKWLVDLTGQPRIRELVPALPDFAVAVWNARDRETIRVAGIDLTSHGPELQYKSQGERPQEPPGDV